MGKETAIFQGLSEQDRIEALKGLAVKTEIQKVRRHYSSDEKDQMKDFVSSESIDLLTKDEEFAAIKKEFKAALKKYRDAITDAIKNLRRGYSENEESVYLVDDQDNGQMNVYDLKGILILNRPLYPHERQSTILEMPKTGTNN